MSGAEREKVTTPSVLEIRLLGPFRITVDGRAVEARRWSRRKPKLLVKLLALQPHQQLHREQAMELLWPDSDLEAAGNNLHKAIHMARHALEPELQPAADSHFILTQGQQIVLHAPKRLWVDVEAFEQAATEALTGEDREAYEAALALYGGDLLAEDIYEDWAARRREQLRGAYQELLIRLARLYEARGRYQQSIKRFKELVACDPSNEEAHRRLMRLHAVLGNRRQALRQYKECCDALREEQDAGPERATVELHGQIVAGLIRPLPGAKERAPQPGAAINSLAILPFVNASSDPASEYLSDGITEGIINGLSQLSQLRVMARSTVFRYKGLDVDPQEVGLKLGVRAVLTGRVLHRGDTLNIQMELVDVSDGSQLWGEQYGRRASDIFEVQEEIAEEITGKLRLRLSGEERGRLTKRHTESAEAYRLYLKGVYFWNKRTLEGVERSIGYFRRAIEADSRYALAYTGLSNSYAKLGDVGLTAIPPKEAFSKARAAAASALEIDDSLAEAHTSLAHVHMHGYEWRSAGREFRRAIELNPNYATAHHWHSYYLIMFGRADEALAEIARALELDPLSLPINTDFGELLYFARLYDRAAEQCRKTLEMDAYFYQAHLVLARVYGLKGRFEESLAESFRAAELSGDSTEALASLGHTLASSGKKKEARDMLTRLGELSQSIYVSPYDVALIHLGLGERDEAFGWLYKAYEEYADWGIYLTVDPRLDALRSDPRFTELVRRVGFRDAEKLTIH
ncbi:MAG: BTAD domain-containing putative transcriptional regulator [Pyrinomonadaceae bacterium]